MVLSGKTLAVIGAGHVGTRVAQYARRVGLRVLLNDPPRRVREHAAELLPLDEVLARADIVTLHVPLSDSGAYPTRDMADTHFFERLQPGALFINTSRGEVVDERALQAAINSGAVTDSILDVWRNEPCIETRLLASVSVATPHIAGYSFEGKLNGTRMIFAELAAFSGRHVRWVPENIPSAPDPVLILAAGRSDMEVLFDATRVACAVERDDHTLRRTLTLPDERARCDYFRQLRRDYPLRREFSAARLELRGAVPALRTMLTALGFQLITSNPS